MTSVEESERAVLDQHEPRLVAEGYRVIRHPRREDVPQFLGHFLPDALAVGRQPNLVLEVIRKGSPNAEEKVRRLKTLLGERPDWRLEILYSGEAEGGLPPTTTQAISELLISAKHICTQEPRAALLLTWAALEALARRLEPQRTARPQSPGRIIELLAGAGYIAPSEAESLRAAANLRNRFVHGDLSVHPAMIDVRGLIAVAEDLLLQVARR